MAGQLDGSHSVGGVAMGNYSFGNTLGLAELMDNDQFLENSLKAELEVLMVGEYNSNRLTVRKRFTRKGHVMLKPNVFPVSDPIPLLSGQQTYS